MFIYIVSLWAVKQQTFEPEGHWLKDAWSRQRISARGLKQWMITYLRRGAHGLDNQQIISSRKLKKD